MGAGKSRTINRLHTPVEDVNYDEVWVDLDDNTILTVENDYVKEGQSFHMSSDELFDFCEEHGLQPPVLGWDLVENNPQDLDVDFYSNPAKAVIKNGDLLYFMYSSMQTVATVQKAFEEATGSDIPLVARIVFEEYADRDDKSTRATAETAIAWKGEKDYYATTITLSSYRDYRLNRRLLPAFYRAVQRHEVLDFIDEHPSFAEQTNSMQGWFSVSGAYGKTTISHELGHALMRTMLNEMPQLKGKHLVSRIKSLVENQELYSDPVSGYATWDHKEAFAECCNLYFYGGKSSSKQYAEFCNIMKDCGLENMYGCLK